MTSSSVTPQLLHAGIELVIGTGITFWLHRKISRVDKRVSVLEDKLKYYENIINRHHELLKSLCSPPPVDSAPRSTHIRSPAGAPAPVIPSPEETMSTPVASVREASVHPPAPAPAPVPVPAPAPAPGSIAVESVDLDTILEAEISDLKNSGLH